MASTDEPASLELWSLAAFRAASFTAAAVLLLHRRGSLAATLSRLDTAIGVAAYLLLWTTTWFATRTGLRRIAAAVVTVAVQRVMPAIVAGGWNGVYVFIAPLIGVLGLVISRIRPLRPADRRDRIDARKPAGIRRRRGGRMVLWNARGAARSRRQPPLRVGGRGRRFFGRPRASRPT
jgi:hypothetical protein